VRFTVLGILLFASVVPAQVIERTIPLVEVGSDFEYPCFLAFDSASNSMFVADEDVPGVLAIDGNTHERSAYIGFGYADWWGLALLSVPGYDRVYYIGEEGFCGIDTRSRTVVVRNNERAFVGGGCNPLNGKLYCPFYEDSLLILDGATGQPLKRLRIGYADEFYERMPFCTNTQNNKVYLYVDDEETEWCGLVVVDGNSDTVTARINVGADYPVVDAMCYDDLNNLVWCSVEDTCDMLVAIDGATDSVVALMCEDDYWFTQLCFDRADGRLYCLDEEYGIVPVDLGTRRLLDLISISSPGSDICVAEREHRLYCMDYGSMALVVFDARDGSWIAEIGGLSWSAAFGYNPGAGEVYCADDEESRVSVIDCAGDTLITHIGTWTLPQAACFDLAGHRLFVAGPERGVVSIVDCNSDSLVARAWVGFDVKSLCWNGADRLLFAGARWVDTLAVIAPDRPAVVTRLPVRGLDNLFYNATHDRVYCCGSDGTSISVLAGDGSRVLDTIPLRRQAETACFDSLGDRLYVARYSDSVAVVDCELDRIVAAMPPVKGNHYCMLAVPEADRLYLGSYRSLTIYDTGTNMTRQSLEFSKTPRRLCPDAAGVKVFCALEDSGIVVVDAAGDTACGRITAPDDVQAVDVNRTSGFVHWLGDSLVGFIDPGTLDQLVPVRVPDLRPFAVCDEAAGLVYCFDLSSVFAVRDRDPAHFVQSRTGPALVSRTVTLYGVRDADLLDAVGRRVMVLHPGANRLVGLAPGAYFVRRRGDGRTQKVVLPR